MLCDEQHARLTRIRAPEQVPEFLEQIDAVFRETWQARTFGYQPHNTASKLSYYRGLAERGWLRSYVLARDAEPIAYEIGCQYQGVFYCRECGYRQSWAEFGPGTVLTNLFIEDLYREDPPGVLDFGFGDSEHKRILSNVEQDAAAIYLAPRNVWRSVLWGQNALNWVERIVRTAR